MAASSSAQDDAVMEEDRSVPPGDSSSTPPLSPGASSGHPDVGASLRLDAWFQDRKQGPMTFGRRRDYVKELVLMRTDLIAASGTDLTRCLALVGIKGLALGKPGTTTRLSVIGVLQQKKRELDAEWEAGMDSSDASAPLTDLDSVLVPVESKNSESSSSSSAPSSQTDIPRRTRRQSSVSRSPVPSSEAVSEAEMALIEIILAGGAEELEHRLSGTGKRWLRTLRPPQSVPASTSSSSASVPSISPVRASPSALQQSRHSVIVDSLPDVRAPRSVPRASVPVPHHPATSTSMPRQVVFDSSSGSSESEGEREAVSRSSARSDIPDDMHGHLIYLGVPEGLATTNVLQQTASMVHPSSYRQYWSSHESAISDRRLYYEGLVLSMLLDSAHDIPLLLEMASRRWLTLYLVSMGSSDWNSAQAFLPLATASGVTALQLLHMAKFAKGVARVARSSSSSAGKTLSYPRSASLSSSRRPSVARKSGKKRTGRGSSSNDGNSSGGTNTSRSTSTRRNGSKDNDYNNSRRRKGAGSEGDRPSDVPSAAVS